MVDWKKILLALGIGGLGVLALKSIAEKKSPTPPPAKPPAKPKPRPTLPALPGNVKVKILDMRAVRKKGTVEVTLTIESDNPTGKPVTTYIVFYGWDEKTGSWVEIMRSGILIPEGHKKYKAVYNIPSRYNRIKAVISGVAEAEATVEEEKKVRILGAKLSAKYAYKSAPYMYVVNASVEVEYDNPSNTKRFVPVNIYVYDEVLDKWKPVLMSHIIVNPGKGTTSQTYELTFNLPGKYTLKAMVGDKWTNEVTVVIEKPVEETKVTNITIEAGKPSTIGNLYAVPITAKVYYDGKPGTLTLAYYVDNKFFMRTSIDASNVTPGQPIIVKRKLYLNKPGTYTVKVCWKNIVCSNEIEVTVP